VIDPRDYIRRQLVPVFLSGILPEVYRIIPSYLVRFTINSDSKNTLELRQCSLHERSLHPHGNRTQKRTGRFPSSSPFSSCQQSYMETAAVGFSTLPRKLNSLVSVTNPLSQINDEICCSYMLQEVCSLYCFVVLPLQFWSQYWNSAGIRRKTPKVTG
jgi:hypothetical protein